MAGQSTSNLRTHLYYKHDYSIDILFPSQQKTILEGKNKEKQVNISRDEKLELNELVYDCVIEDSRTFLDFRKRGISRIFDKLKPGYKPPCRQTIAKHLKKK